MHARALISGGRRLTPRRVRRDDVRARDDGDARAVEAPRGERSHYTEDQWAGIKAHGAAVDASEDALAQATCALTMGSRPVYHRRPDGEEWNAALMPRQAACATDPVPPHARRNYAPAASSISARASGIRATLQLVAQLLLAPRRRNRWGDPTLLADEAAPSSAGAGRGCASSGSGRAPRPPRYPGVSPARTSSPESASKAPR
jgi:hypothetical protein